MGVNNKMMTAKFHLAALVVPCAWWCCVVMPCHFAPSRQQCVFVRGVCVSVRPNRIKRNVNIKSKSANVPLKICQ